MHFLRCHPCNMRSPPTFGIPNSDIQDPSATPKGSYRRISMIPISKLSPDCIAMPSSCLANLLTMIRSLLDGIWKVMGFFLFWVMRFWKIFGIRVKFCRFLIYESCNNFKIHLKSFVNFQNLKKKLLSKWIWKFLNKEFRLGFFTSFINFYLWKLSTSFWRIGFFKFFTKKRIFTFYFQVFR